MKTPYLSINQKLLLLAAAALFFGLTPAIHAEGLSGLKDSLNKGEIDSTLIEQTKQQSDISDVPQNSISADKPATKLQTPVKKVQIKKPARIKEVQVKKSGSRLKRIGAPVKTPDQGSYSFSISNFPAIDETKYKPEALTMLKAMREKATGYGNVEYDLNDFCAKYSEYTELCNLGRLYVIQQKLKISKTYDFNAQKYLEELTSEFVYGSNEVTAFIDGEVKKMIPVLNKYNNEVIEKQLAYAKKEVERLQKELSDMIKNSVFKPADLDYLKSEITAKYRKMIEAYAGMKITNEFNQAEAQKFIKEITAFYNSLPLKVTIKFQESPDKPPIDKEISVTKDGRTFVNCLYSYIEAKIQHCQYSTDDKEFNSILNGKSETANDMDTFDDFIARINKQPAGEIVFIQAEKDTYIKNIENYRQNVAKIKRIYFQKDISYGTLLPDYIAKTNECILLKAEVLINDPENHDIKILTPPVKIELFSNASKISSEVILKKSAIAKGYCAAMGNTNANIWPINDKPGAQKESLAILSGYMEDTKDGKYLYDSIYFDTKLIYSTMGTTTIDIQQRIIPSSESFCHAGGGEFMTVTSKNDKNTKADIIIKNPAKWFVIEAHGDPDNGSIQYGLSNGEKAILKFGQAKDLFKDNIDVLFLNSCYCLSYDTMEAEIWAQGWHNALPNGLIAGYHNVVSPFMTTDVFNFFAKRLNDCRVNGKILTKNEIGQMWLNTNIAYSQYFWAVNGSDALKARYALNENNDEYYKYWYIGFVQALPTSPPVIKPLHIKIKE